MKRSPLAALTAFVAALFVFGLAGPALAHDSLKSSDPAKGSTVEAVDQVSLVFSEGVRMPTVLVRGADGVAHQAGKPSVDGAKVRQALKEPLGAGKYTIAYRVVSSDGHPIEGEIPFTVKAASPTPSATPSQAAATPSDTPLQAADQKSAAADQKGVAKEETGTAFPVWLVIVVGALVGIGIGFLLSVRKKKP
ncbi:copper resistance CopC family protein [Nonomuraea sediminis]|uniref:copper resistance CopC family protein n=1 Tax=Nonomuraea sediminis TaxID=2835864 RepID=UPI001BDBB8B1|nr:copper resistance CopC family protein [Nonomuraea sediminis]